MRIASDGKVGISEGNAPTQVLNLYRSGSTATYMAAGNSNTGLNGTYFGVDGTGNAIVNQTQALPLIFYTSGTERMRITSGGSVTINLPTDSIPLTLNGVEISMRTTGTSAGYTQGAIALQSGTTDNPSGRGQGVFMWNSGKQATWYMGTSYGDADTFMIGRKGSTSSVDTATAQTSFADITIGVNGNVTVKAPASGIALAVDSISQGNAQQWSDGTRSAMINFTSGVQFGATSNHNLDLSTNNTVRATIDTSGNFGIGYSSSLDYKLKVNGTIYASGDITALSDIRVKKDLAAIENALDKVCSLTGYTFAKREEENGRRYTGLVAQEVQKVLPEAISEGQDEQKTLSVAYGNLMGLIVEAVKELKAENAALRAELKALKGE